MSAHPVGPAPVPSSVPVPAQVVEVDTPHGPGRLHLHPSDRPAPGPMLLLSHGAGNGVKSRDLAALAGALPASGVGVALLEQPWRVAGRRVATPPPTLDAGLRAGAELLRTLPGWDAVPLVVGGRSAGARSALRCAIGLDAVGVLALAFPLHPPGRPERSRLAELVDVGVATLLVQGERDTMGRPEELPDPLPAHVRLHVVPAGDHGLAVPRRADPGQGEVLAAVCAAVLAWLRSRG